MSCALSYKSSKYTSTLTAISNITSWSSIGYNRNIITFQAFAYYEEILLGKIFNSLSVIHCSVDLPKYLQIHRVVLAEGWHIQLKQFYFSFLNLLVSLTDDLLSSIRPSFCYIKVTVGPEAIKAVKGQEKGNSPDNSPVYLRTNRETHSKSRLNYCPHTVR